MSSAAVIASWLMAAGVCALAGYLSPTSLAARVLPWVEPGWRPQRLRRQWKSTSIAAWPSALRRQPVSALPAVLGFLGTYGLSANPLAATAVAAAASACALQYVQVLRRRAHLRSSERIAAEISVFAEYIALCVSSGISVDAAVDRSRRYLQGHIASALKGSPPTDVRSHIPVKQVEPAEGSARTASAAVTDEQQLMSGIERLNTFAHESGSVPLRHFVDAVLTSQALGTPLAEVLFAQAQQMRALRQQQLLAFSGRREVLMLIPIVFVIFPVVVAVALFPAWVQLNGSVW